MITGRIVELLASTTSHRAVIVLDLFQVSTTCHEVFGMPMLTRRHGEPTYIIIPSTVCFFGSSIVLF